MNYEHIVEPSYIIFKEDSKILARNGKTGVVEYSGTNASTVIQSVINALTNGGKIFIKKEVQSGLITVNKGNIVLEGEKPRQYSTLGSPYIQKIKFDSSSQEIRSCIIRNLQIDELNFYVATNNIRYIYFDTCAIRSYSTANKNGIVFTGDNGSAYVDFIYFSNCYFYHSNSPSGYGFISLKSSNTTSLILSLSNCSYYTGTADMTFLQIDSNAGILSLFSQHTQFVAGDDWKFINIQGENTSSGLYNGINVHDGSFEIHATTNNSTLLTIGSSEVNMYCSIEIHDNRITIQSGSTLKLIDNSNNNWGTRQNCFSFHNNRFFGAGTVELGTPNTSTYFQVLVRNNRGFKTENSGTATISSGNTYVDVTHNLASTPSSVLVVPKSDTRFWVDNVGSSTFRINIPSSLDSDVTFYWKAEV